MRRNDEDYRATQTIQTEDALSIPSDDASTFRALPKNDSKVSTARLARRPKCEYTRAHVQEYSSAL